MRREEGVPRRHRGARSNPNGIWLRNVENGHLTTSGMRGLLMSTCGIPSTARNTRGRAILGYGESSLEGLDELLQPMCRLQA